MIRCLSLLAIGFMAACKKEDTTASKEDSNCRCCTASYIPLVRDTLPATTLRAGVPIIPFASSTKNAEAAQFISQGMSCIHYFWELEAWRSFRRASELDPEAPMAYIGMALSLPGQYHEFRKEREEMVKMARSKIANGNDLEKMYLPVLDALMANGTNATLPYLEKLVRAHPTDQHGKALYTFYMRQGYDIDSKATPRHQQAIELAETYLKEFPDNAGLHHYYIHILESGPDFAKALPSALKVAQDSPAVGHLLHMPGHIYFFNGDFKDSEKSFLAADKMEREYLAAEKLSAYDHPNYVHNLFFLSVLYAEMGAKKQALETAKNLRELPLQEDRKEADGWLQIYIIGMQAEARIHMRLRDWSSAAKSLESYTADTPRDALARIFRFYCLAKQSLKENNIQQADANFNQMQKQMEELKKGAPKRGSGDFYYRGFMQVIEAYKAELYSAIYGKKGDANMQDFWARSAREHETAIGYMEPPGLACLMDEMLGWNYLENKRFDKALESFERASKLRPKNPYIHRGFSLSYEGLGQQDKAKEMQTLSESYLQFADADFALPQP